MDIQDLGSIGEFVSSIAVVATLLFVAFQLRQTTKALRASTFQDINQDQIRLTQDARAIFDIFKESRGESLGIEDRMKAGEFFYNAFRSYETAWYQFREGNLDSVAFEGHRRWMVWGLANPSGSWNKLKVLFHPEFCAFVDELLSERKWEDHPMAKIISDDKMFDKITSNLDTTLTGKV